MGGVSQLPVVECCQDSLFKIADDMLYQAKKEGKNRIKWQNGLKENDLELLRVLLVDDEKV